MNNLKSEIFGEDKNYSKEYIDNIAEHGNQFNEYEHPKYYNERIKNWNQMNRNNPEQNKKYVSNYSTNDADQS